jgi:hypothetical protein
MIKASAGAAPADRHINGGRKRMFRGAIGNSHVLHAPGNCVGRHQFNKL